MLIKPNKICGFSLVEITIVLLVLSVLSAAGLTVYQSQDYKSRKEVTQETLDKLEQAILNYRNLHHRLPCPADGRRQAHEAGAGYESGHPGHCLGDSAIHANAEDGNTVVGVVPVRTLGLRDEDMYDGWGRRITYAVDRRMTYAQATLEYDIKDCGIGSIRVQDSTGTVLTSRAIYALLSHGENGHGAYMASGERRDGRSEHTDELENANQDSVFVMRREVRESTNILNRFDDILRFKERWAIVNAVDLKMYKEEKFDKVFVSGGAGMSCGTTNKKRTICWNASSARRLPHEIDFAHVPDGVFFTDMLLRYSWYGGGGSWNFAYGSDNVIYSWGKNDAGQLGVGDTVNRNSPVPMDMSEVPDGVLLRDITPLCVSDCEATKSFYAKGTDGIYYVWGQNSNGILGVGDTLDRLRPTPVDMSNVPAGVRFESYGAWHALGSDGRHYLWSPSHAAVTVLTPTAPDMSAYPGVSLRKLFINNRSWHWCALANDGRVYCWGNSGGSACARSLGHNVTTHYTYPVPVLMTQVPSGVTFTDLFMQNGDGGFSVGGGAYAGGMNTSGSSIGFAAKGSDGELYVWGCNSKSIGRGNLSNPRIPAPIDKTNIPTGVTIEEVHRISGVSYARASNGLYYAWGNNSRTLDLERPTLWDIMPPVPSGRVLKNLHSPKYDTYYAEDNMGDMYFWGTTSGLGGWGDNSDRAVPTPIDMTEVPSGVRFKQLSISPNSVARHVIALGSDGKIYGWGRNSSGELGTGDREARLRPVPAEIGHLPPSTRFVSAHAIYYNASAAACGFSRDKRLYCWGYRNYIGVDSPEARILLPTEVKIPECG